MLVCLEVMGKKKGQTQTGQSGKESELRLERR